MINNKENKIPQGSGIKDGEGNVIGHPMKRQYSKSLVSSETQVYSSLINNIPEKHERLDDGYLIFFNNRMKFFKNISQNRETEKYSIIDRQLYDKKGRLCNIELKTRYCDIFKYDGIFIEEKKYLALKKDYEEKNIIPLYINFFQDGYHVWLVNLEQYFSGKKKLERKKVTIENWGYGRVDEDETRYLIPQRDGVYYEYNDTNDRFNKIW